MTIVALVVLGMLMGWLAEWAIDWVYWRGRLKDATSEITTLKERIRALEARKSPQRLSAKNLPLVNKDGSDNLQAIKGIGPVFAKRLKDCEVISFEQLSRLRSQQLEEMLGTLYKRFFSREETILAQAREYAKLRTQDT